MSITAHRPGCLDFAPPLVAVTRGEPERVGGAVAGLIDLFGDVLIAEVEREDFGPEDVEADPHGQTSRASEVPGAQMCSTGLRARSYDEGCEPARWI
jgi:hypothetical protein